MVNAAAGQAFSSLGLASGYLPGDSKTAASCVGVDASALVGATDAIEKGSKTLANVACVAAVSDDKELYMD